MSVSQLQVERRTLKNEVMGKPERLAVFPLCGDRNQFGQPYSVNLAPCSHFAISKKNARSR